MLIVVLRVHAGYAKTSVCTFAVSVLNADPMRTTRERDLRVIAVCDKRVLKARGFDEIIQPILDDLNRLRAEGICLSRIYVCLYTRLWLRY